jgi:hypothetical protein
MKAQTMLDTPSAIRLKLYGDIGDATNGAMELRLRCSGHRCHVIFSDGEGWDHVSVSLPHRCPTWDEMCEVKKRFFEDEDCVVQFHPPASKYRNLHHYCLHLWRWQHGEFPQPNPVLVAPDSA